MFSNKFNPMKTNTAITEIPASPSTAHTPGPWKVRVSHNGALRGYSIEHEDETLRSIVARNWEHELCEEHGNSLPNARLIAAAPELLEVLVDVQTWLETNLRLGKINCGTANRESDLVSQLSAAIAKATGQS